MCSGLPVPVIRITGIGVARAAENAASSKPLHSGISRSVTSSDQSSAESDKISFARSGSETHRDVAPANSSASATSSAMSGASSTTMTRIPCRESGLTVFPDPHLVEASGLIAEGSPLFIIAMTQFELSRIDTVVLSYIFQVEAP